MSIRARNWMATAAAALMGFSAAACGDSEEVTNDEDSVVGKADAPAQEGDVVEPASVYNPLGLPEGELLGYVNDMRADLLADELTPELFTGRTAGIQAALDTADQAYLMMALAGMEYYPITDGDSGETILDETLRNVVEFGDPAGEISGAPTGLELVGTAKKQLLGFRSDVVRVKGRPHFVVAVRGTQIKQPTFIASLTNIVADLSAVGIDFHKALNIEADFAEARDLETLADLSALRDELLEGTDRLDSEMFSKIYAVVHAGFFLSATMVYGGPTGLAETVKTAIAEAQALPADDPDAIDPDEKACVWLTGHSLGGAMVPIIAYRLTTDDTFHRNAAICGVYAYGAPRVGNGGFADDYNDRDIAYGSRAKLGDVTFRYANAEDLIPHVPPNIPRYWGRGRAMMSEFVAETLMYVAYTYARDIADFRALLPKVDAAVEAGAVNEAYALIEMINPDFAAVLAGPGQMVLDTYDVMFAADEAAGGDGTLKLTGEGYQIAKDFIAFGNEEDHFSLQNITNDFPGISTFKGLQHVGHTRWIQRGGPEQYAIQAGVDDDDRYQEHHVRWMLSFIDSMRRAACIDELNEDANGTAVRQQVANSLTFHRTPYYAAITHSMSSDPGPRHSYPEGDDSFHLDRLERGVDFSTVPGFEDALYDRYNEEEETFFSCQ